MIALGVANDFAQSQDKISKEKVAEASPAISKQSKPTANKYKIRQEIFPYRIGATDLKIVVSKTSSKPSKFVYFNMHDNENTSVEAVVEIIKKYGGTLVELQNGGERLIKFSLKDNRFTFDPNRIFTVDGIKKTLKFSGDSSIESQTEVVKFAGKLESYLKKVRLIIAVHNNTDENYSIKSYEKDGEFAADAKLVNINSEIDADDFFYVTEKTSFERLKEKNQNVALQNNAQVTDDGSLSVYCGRNKIAYINVEGEHGHLRQQTEMLEILRRLIEIQISAKKKFRGK